MSVPEPTDPASEPTEHTAEYVSQPSPTVEPTSGFTPAGKADVPTGTVIAGRYTLAEVIGEGGMGSVYRANQTEPVKRQVALKLIKGGLDSRTVIARFEAERQALALMDHPNIARIFDGGVTPTGQPFFVMELVDGDPITQFCDERRLDIRARLELFVAVCQAVQHAHQKGIIHRDLKPGNVLVTEVDGRPTPKVIDFGVAKATEQKLTDLSLVDVGAVVGTPMYMSPEQADPTSMDIDTRTDVFSLGVILYELLVGSPPIDAREFRRGAILEMMRMVREVDPPRPSTKLSTADSRPSIAANRNIEPAQLAKLLRSELDWITLKALEKDRTRRYETANGLLRDIQRYLADEPVEARPPSSGYRLRKFVRRNRGAVTAAAAVVVSLFAGVVGFAWEAKVATRARDRAEFAEGEATKRADELQKVSDYQAKMLQQIDPADAGVRLMSDLRARHKASLEQSKLSQAEAAARIAAFDRELPAVNGTDAAVALIDRTILGPAVRTINAQFADQPLVDASLRTTLGVIYQTIGRPAEALALYRRAYEIRREALGEDNADTLASRYGMGKTLGDTQQLAEAERTVRATLAGYERTLGADHHETLETKILLASQLNLQGRYDEGVAINREVLERRRQLLGAEHPDTLSTMNDLGRSLINAGKYAEAVKTLREAVDAKRRSGNSDMAAALSNLCVALIRQKEHAAAEPFMREALAARRRTLGEEHPDTVGDLNNLATLLMDLNKLQEAETLAKDSLAKCRRVLGDEHAKTLAAMNVMGQVLYRQNKYTETEPLYQEALATGRRVLGEEHPDVVIWTANMGFLMQRLGRIGEAEQYYREAVEKNRKALGDSHPYTLTMLKDLIGILRQENKPADAAVYVRAAWEGVRKKNGDEDPAALALLSTLGAVLRDAGKLDEAEVCLRQSMEQTRKKYGPDHASTMTEILRLASLRVAQGKYGDAIALITPIKDKIRTIIPGQTGTLRAASAIGLLGKARAGLAKQPADFAAAEASLLEAQSIFAKLRGEHDKETRDWVQGLVAFYTAWDKAEPGKAHAAKAAEWKTKLNASPKAPPSIKK